jgi:hypothetical protein
MLTAIGKNGAIPKGKTGKLEKGAVLTEADAPVRALTIHYPCKFCKIYKASQSLDLANLNLWPLWTPKSLWKCFN